jgi:hypothetical protein
VIALANRFYFESTNTISVPTVSQSLSQTSLSTSQLRSESSQGTSISNSQSQASTSSSEIFNSSISNDGTTYADRLLIRGVVVAWGGPLGQYFQLYSPTFSNRSYVIGENIPINFSVLFLTSSDEGVSYNGTTAYLNVTIESPGFQLVSVELHNNFDQNPIFVTSNTLI